MDIWGRNEKVKDDMNWNPADNLSVIPEFYYQIANKLSKYIHIKPSGNEENPTVCISHPELCSNHTDLPVWSYLHYKIDTGIEKKNYGDYNTSVHSELTRKCNNENCPFHVCPYKIAGYIKYLKKYNPEKLIQQREAYRINREKIDKSYSMPLDFQVSISSNFIVSAKDLEKAEYLVDCGLVEVSRRDYDGKVGMHVTHPQDCEYPEVLKELLDGTYQYKGRPVRVSSSGFNLPFFKYRCRFEDNRVCTHRKCIIQIAGMIDYMRRKGIYGSYKEKMLRLKKQITWKPVKNLSVIPEQYYVRALRLMEYVDYFQDPVSGEIYVEHPGYCGDQKRPWTSLSQQKELVKNGVRSSLKTLSNEGLIGRCDHSSCIFHICPYRLAAYIKYLKNENYEELVRQREEYQKNKRSVDAKYSMPLKYARPLPSDLKLPIVAMKAAEALIDHGCFEMEDNHDEKTASDYPLKIAYPLDYFEKRIEISDCVKKAAIEEISFREMNHSQILVNQKGLCNNHCTRTNCSIGIVEAVDYMRRKGTYEAFLRKMQEKESVSRLELESIAGDNEKFLDNIHNENLNSFYSYVAGDDRKEVKKVADMVAQELSQTFRILAKPKQQKMCQLTYSLVEANTHLGIVNVYDPLPEKQILMLDGISEFIDAYQRYVKESAQSSMGQIKSYALEHFIEELKEYRKDIYIILYGTKQEITEFLNLDKTLQLIFRENVLELENMTADEVYEQFLGQVAEEFRLDEPEGFREQFLEYISFNEPYLPFKNQTLAEYLADYVNIHRAMILPPNMYQRENLKDQLNNLIGLDEVKAEVDKFESYARFSQMAIAQGMKLPQSNLHMMFTGNPGTGKTTVARIIAKLLYDIGLLKENKFTEVERKDLVGQYIGQTAPKTAHVIDKAMGGVLFIDEAYSLTPTSSKDYGAEALATLIKAMEDHKGEFVVIFAGYKNEMQEFLRSNPGISSRIGYTFHFKDYSVEDLVKMYLFKMKESGFTVSFDALNKVQEIMEYFQALKHFGNGRFVDRVIQKTIIEHAVRSLDFTVLNRITEEDIPQIKDLIEQAADNSYMVNPDELTDEDIRRVAVHELGHALTAFVLNGDSNLKSISVKVNADGSLGRVIHKSNRSVLLTEQQLLNRIAVLLSGRGAERLIFGVHSSGCSSDYTEAKRLAKKMVEEYAMGTLGSDDSNQILMKAEEIADQILNEKKEKLENMIRILMDRKEISGSELDQMFIES